MIKFQLFDTAQSYQCHFAEISTFVVSIAHYMRAYFNYQALQEGKDFQLPEDAAFLNVSTQDRRTDNCTPADVVFSPKRTLCLLVCLLPCLSLSTTSVKAWENLKMG